MSDLASFCHHGIQRSDTDRPLFEHSVGPRLARQTRIHALCEHWHNNSAHNRANRNGPFSNLARWLADSVAGRFAPCWLAKAESADRYYWGQQWELPLHGRTKDITQHTTVIHKYTYWTSLARYNSSNSHEYEVSQLITLIFQYDLHDLPDDTTTSDSRLHYSTDPKLRRHLLTSYQHRVDREPRPCAQLLG